MFPELANYSYGSTSDHGLKQRILESIEKRIEKLMMEADIDGDGNINFLLLNLRDFFPRPWSFTTCLRFLSGPGHQKSKSIWLVLTYSLRCVRNISYKSGKQCPMEKL